MADNVRHVQKLPIDLLLTVAVLQMWLQAVAIVLPRVQDQYSSPLIHSQLHSLLLTKIPLLSI